MKRNLIRSLLATKKHIYYIQITLIVSLIVLIILFVQGFERTQSSLEIKCLLNETEQYAIAKNTKSTAKIHIAYVHYLDTTEENTAENFRFFMHFAHEPCHSDVDFTIILNVNKPSTVDSILDSRIFRRAFSDIDHLERFKSCQDASNPRRNTHVIVRGNTPGGDLCAFAQLFKQADYWTLSKSTYEHFFFINSSARGPFVPNYWLRKW